ncbi:MAG: dihydroneopterin aldolase [Cellvibrionaceae bacterium]
MDKVLVRQLRLETIIGLFPWERVVRQQVFVDLEMEVDIAKAAQSDDLEFVVNYAEVCEHVTLLADAGQFKLIETFVERIAEMILKDFDVSWIRVSVHKTDVMPQVASVGVQIERAR